LDRVTVPKEKANAKSELCVPRWLLTNAKFHNFGVNQQYRTDPFSKGRPIDFLI
jgi:hypothetical protein